MATVENKAGNINDNLPQDEVLPRSRECKVHKHIVVNIDILDWP